MECIWEEVRQETAFCIFYSLNIRNQTQCTSISNASYNCIKSNCSKLFHKRFCSNPMIAQKHHGFFTALMSNIYHFLCQLCDFSALKCLEIFKFLAWNAILVIIIALIDYILRTEWITHLFFKLL